MACNIIENVLCAPCTLPFKSLPNGFFFLVKDGKSPPMKAEDGSVVSLRHGYIYTAEADEEVYPVTGFRFGPEI